MLEIGLWIGVAVGFGFGWLAAMNAPKYTDDCHASRRRTVTDQPERCPLCGGEPITGEYWAPHYGDKPQFVRDYPVDEQFCANWECRLLRTNWPRVAELVAIRDAVARMGRSCSGTISQTAFRAVSDEVWRIAEALASEEREQEATE